MTGLLYVKKCKLAKLEKQSFCVTMKIYIYIPSVNDLKDKHLFFKVFQI